MADKGNVYYCSWSKTDGGYVGWEEKRPSVRVEAATPDRLVQELGEVVGEYHNDHEAALQFDPPLPGKKQYEHLFRDGIVTVRWNEGWRYWSSVDTAFAQGRCTLCKRGLGPRSAEPLIVDDFAGGTDGAFMWSDMPGRLAVVSEAFLALLTKQERSAFDVREVKWSRKRRVRFFEILPKWYVPTVAIRGTRCDGWVCDVCGYRSYSHGSTLGWLVTTVCRADLPSPLPPLFVVGEPREYCLCVSKARWLELRGRPGTRKMTSGRLAIVEEQDCERNPKLPTWSEKMRESERRRSQG